MIFFINSLILFILLILSCFFKKNKYIFSYFVLIFLSAFRFETGPDWESYYNYYNDYKVYQDIFKFETGYYFLIKAFNTIGVSYVGYQIITSIIYPLPLMYFFKKYSKNTFFSLLIYFNSLYLIYNMGVNRQFTALMITIFAYNYLIEKEYKKYIFFIFVAYLFHSSAIIGIILIFLRELKISHKGIKKLCYVAILFFILAILKIDLATVIVTRLNFLPGFVLNKINNYTNPNYVDIDSFINIGIGLWIEFILCVILIYLRKPKSKLEKYFYLIVVVGLIGKYILIKFPTFSRLMDYYIFFKTIILTYYLEPIKRIRYRFNRSIILIILFIIISSTTIRILLQGDSQLLPYYFILR